MVRKQTIGRKRWVHFCFKDSNGSFLLIHEELRPEKPDGFRILQDIFKNSTSVFSFDHILNEKVDKYKRKEFRNLLYIKHHERLFEEK